MGWSHSPLTSDYSCVMTSVPVPVMLSLSKLQEIVEDKKVWHGAVHGVEKSWMNSKCCWTFFEPLEFAFSLMRETGMQAIHLEIWEVHTVRIDEEGLVATSAPSQPACSCPWSPLCFWLLWQEGKWLGPLLSTGPSSGLNSPSPESSRGFTSLCLWSLEKEMATPLQYSCLENPMDGGAW